MDELISLALKALEEKKAAQAGQPQAVETSAERYRRILDDLRVRGAAPPFGGPSAAPPQQPAPTEPVLSRVEGLAKPAPPPPAPPEPVERRPLQHGPLHGLFEGGNSLLRAVVAAELLDRPLALRENAYWQKR